MKVLSIWLLLCAPLSAQNLVLIVGDDMDCREFGFMGSPSAVTPNLDWLAREGSVFTRVQCPASICRPNIATLITGRQPWEHGIWSHPKAHYPAMQPSGDTLPGALSAAGYRTRIDGNKWWEGDTGHAHERGYIESGGNTAETSYFRTTIAGSTDFIARCAASGEPFALACFPQTPHLPHTAPAGQLARINPAGITAEQVEYLAMVAWFDEWIGAIIGQLAISGVLDDTLIVFIPDNGWRSNAPAKSSPYEAGHRVPLILRGPGIPPGRYDRLAEQRDVMPTILDCLGVQIPDAVTGQSLWPITQGVLDCGEPQIVFGYQQPHSQTWPGAVRAVSEDGWSYVCWLADVTPQWSAAGTWWLYHHGGTGISRAAGSQELYHVADDPAELQPVDDAAQLAAMRDAANAWWTGLGRDPLPSAPGEPADQILDDEHLLIVSGTWGTGVLGYQGDCRWHATGTGSAAAEWRVFVAPGRYRVSVTWAPASNRATNTPFAVLDGSTPLQTVRVNQQVSPADRTDAGVGWRDLSEVEFTGPIVVRITNGADGYVIADAVRIERMD